MTDREEHWNMQFERLVAFKRNNGHCVVPKRCEQDKSLGHRARTQRALHTENKMRHDRWELLDDLGFVWDVEDHKWYLGYEKLVDFKRENRHCIVPRRYRDVGRWVFTQRALHDKNKIRFDRK